MTGRKSGARRLERPKRTAAGATRGPEAATQGAMGGAVTTRKRTLDHLVYPYIFDKILSFSSNGTLARILRTSQHTADRAARILYHHIEVHAYNERTWPFLGWDIQGRVPRTRAHRDVNMKSRFLLHLEILTVKAHGGQRTDIIWRRIDRIRPPALRLYRHLHSPVQLAKGHFGASRMVIDPMECSGSQLPGIRSAYVSRCTTGVSPVSAYYLSQRHQSRNSVFQIGLAETGWVHHLEALPEQEAADASASGGPTCLTMLHLPNHKGRFHLGKAGPGSRAEDEKFIDASFKSWLAAISIILRFTHTKLVLVGCDIFDPLWVHPDVAEGDDDGPLSASKAVLSSLSVNVPVPVHPSFRPSPSSTTIPGAPSRVTFVQLADYLMSTEGKEIVGREACIRYHEKIPRFDGVKS